MTEVVNPVGRPSLYQPELANRILAEIAAGRSLNAICREEWCPDKTTVLRWVATHNEFRNQYAQAREEQAEVWADEIVDIADDGTNDYVEQETKKGTIVLCDHENINRSRLRVDTRKWVLSKLLPKKYGERTAITDPDGNAPTFRLVIEHVGKGTQSQAAAEAE